MIDKITSSFIFPPCPIFHETAFIFSLMDLTTSISCFISPTLRYSNFLSLYIEQNSHLFHGQFLVARISNEKSLPSLGGLIGPISKEYRLGFSIFML